MEGPLRYACIDLKTFYASVECADRGLDPFSTRLVVADAERGPGTICLAVSPAMKALGVRNRCRVFEIPRGIDYVMATPRMSRYLEVSHQINGICARFVSPTDTHVYSVDESFFDLGPYLALARTDARAMARRMMDAILAETGITATAGLGTNLFLAKVALDVLAKHASDGIASLDEDEFRERLWFHRPLTDIWGIGPATERRLRRHGIADLAGICAAGRDWCMHEFGVRGEWLLDHAWGQETCTIADIHAHRPRKRSLSSGQVLMRDYTASEARAVLDEMVVGAALDMRRKGLSCGSVSLWVGFVRPLETGGKLAMGASGRRKLEHRTGDVGTLRRALLSLFDGRVPDGADIRRVSLAFGDVDVASADQPTLWDVDGTARRAELEDAVCAVRERFGKNALLTGTSLMPCATMRERNNQIGGHRA